MTLMSSFTQHTSWSQAEATYLRSCSICRSSSSNSLISLRPATITTTSDQLMYSKQSRKYMIECVVIPNSANLLLFHLLMYSNPPPKSCLLQVVIAVIVTDNKVCFGDEKQKSSDITVPCLYGVSRNKVCRHVTHFVRTGHKY